MLLGACLLLAGCPATDDPSPAERTPSPQSSADALPALPTGASTGLPAYDGPPADAPPSVGPLLSVLATVDLTPATPGFFARTQATVGSPDGGAYVVMTPADGDLPQILVTVGGPGDGYALTRAVQIPRVSDVWGMHLLPDGAVVVTGRLGNGGYGFVAADPATGTSRSTLVLPAEPETDSVDGRSVISGTTLFVFLTTETADGSRDALAAVDLVSGRLLAERDLADDVARASVEPIGKQIGGLVARPDGGVTLAFDASPTAVAEDRIPTLLRFDRRLEPVGDPVRATDLAEGAEIQAVSGSADGTVFLLAEVQDATWVLAIPDGGGAGPVLAQVSDRIYDYALVVEPAQVWALLPDQVGLRALDLSTGEEQGPVELVCGPNLDIQHVLPAADGVGAVLMGECDDPREDTQMVWIVGP